MTIRQWRLLGRTVFVGGAATAGILLGWSGLKSLSAQTPKTGFVSTEQTPLPEATPVERNYMRQSVIDLPINMKEEARALIQEIHLYVKEQPGAAWTLRDKGNATAQSFRFQAPRDGEYWFTMVTVDQQGRSFPKDLQNEPPGLVVVIDTQKPTVEMTNYGESPEGQLVHCTVKDAHLDNARSRFYFQSGDKTFRSLEQVPGRVGVYCVPAQAVSTGLVRMVAEDLAGNQTVSEEHLNRMQTRSVSASGITQSSVNPPVTPKTSVNPPVTPIPEPKAPNPLRISTGETQEIDPPAPRSFQTMPALVEEPSRVASARPDGSENPRFMDENVLASSKPLPNVSVEKPAPQVTQPELPLIAPTPVKNEVITKRQVVNHLKLYLEYQIENGVANNQSMVEVWLTRDQGKSWQRHATDSAKKSPIEVQLPGEGVFGLTLVATNGRPTTAPTGAAAADMWIEVDTTKPIAQISSVKVSHDKGQPHVDIQWSVTDTNLGDGPVELFYAPTVQGKWLPIAQGLKAEGTFRWTPPAEIGVQAHLRLIARDAAGNTTICDTLGAVALEDPSRPRVTIRQVRTEAPVAPTTVPVVPTTVPFQIIQPSRTN